MFSSNSNKMLNIVLFGPPGAGKGTQANFLKQKYDLVHISTGDIFRYNIKNQTPLGKLAKSHMDKGSLVPDQLTVDMLASEVLNNSNSKGFIFDGFPRNIYQANALQKLLLKLSAEVNAMIALEVPDNILIERLLNRGKTSGRTDDSNESIIRNRIGVYYKETAVLKSFYLNKGRYYGVSGVGEIDEIKDRLIDIIDSM